MRRWSGSRKTSSIGWRNNTRRERHEANAVSVRRIGVAGADPGGGEEAGEEGRRLRLAVRRQDAQGMGEGEQCTGDVLRQERPARDDGQADGGRALGEDVRE